jgi:hypothetical protein
MKVAIAILFLSDSLVFGVGKKNRPIITQLLRLLAWRSVNRLRRSLSPISSAMNSPTRPSKGRRALSFFFSVPPIGDLSAKRSSCSCKTLSKDLGPVCSPSCRCRRLFDTVRGYQSRWQTGELAGRGGISRGVRTKEIKNRRNTSGS